MLPILAELTLRGTFLCGLVWLLERALATRIQAQSRRIWWAIAALAFLLPLRLHVHHVTPFVPRPVQELIANLVQPKPGINSTVNPSAVRGAGHRLMDRKSTRLNSSHLATSDAV